MNALYMQLLNTQLWLNHIIATVKSSHLKYCDFAEGKISLSIITKTKLFRDITHLGKNIKIYPISLQSFHQCSRGVKQKKHGISNEPFSSLLMSFHAHSPFNIPCYRIDKCLWWNALCML